MKITVANFNSNLKAADVAKLPTVLKDSYKDVKDMLDLYDDDEDIKKFIDVYVSKLNQALATKTTSTTDNKRKPKNKISIPSNISQIMGAVQYSALLSLHKGEESEAAVRIIKGLKDALTKLPKLYGTDGKKNHEKIVYLHYFSGGSDWFINEYDPSTDQFFGYAILNGDYQMSEHGYISLNAFKKNNIELDFYWTPIPLDQALYKVNPSYFDKPKETTAKKKHVTRRKGDKSSNEQKKPNYAGIKVEIRPYSTNSSAFIIWDIESDHKFANEKFKDVVQANEFINKNKMTLVKNSSPTTKQVAEIALEVRFIKRYVLMDGKKKTRKQLLAFINTMQRALTKKQINKSSKYAKEIEHIEKELVKIYNDNKVGNTFTFRLDESDKNVVKKFSKIAHSQQQRTSVRLISRFIGIHGRISVKEKAEKLLKAIKQAFKNKKIISTDPYYKKVKQVESNLENYISAKEEKLVISDAQLRGLQGLTFPKNQTQKTTNTTVPNNLSGLNINSSGIMSSLDVAKMKHKTCGFTGKWLSLIGDPSSPFSMMFWSRPGKGKSSLSIELAHYFASKFNRRVLFVAVEEGFNYTIQEKFERLNAVHPNIDIASSMPDSIAAYDIVFIDSVNRAKMVVDDFVDLKNKYPDKSFVLIFQATVDGNYRGGKEWEHEVDVSININENGYAKTQKSRFGGNGSIKVFQGNTDHIYKFTNLQDAEKFVANRKDEKLRIVNGDDGRKWVTNADKAQELKMQGYELY